MHRDDSLVPPPAAIVHETRNLAPRVHRPKVELTQAHGVDRLRLHASLTARRLLLPDPSSPWLLTAVPAAIRLVRRYGIDAVITSSPPGSVNLLGAAVKRATGVRWVADLRDSLISHPHRRQNVRGERWVAELVARRADAIVCVAPAAVEEMQALSPRGPVELIDHGADFDDFEGLEYTRGDRFRITHTGHDLRPPRPEAVPPRARTPGRRRRRPLRRRLPRGRPGHDRRARPGRAGRARSPTSRAGRHSPASATPTRSSCSCPTGEGRGRFVVTTKIFEYLAAGRPILAAVPEDGAAAALLRETGAGVVAPLERRGRDCRGPRRARASAGATERSTASSLEPAVRESLSRRVRIERFAELLRSLP